VSCGFGRNHRHFIALRSNAFEIKTAPPSSTKSSAIIELILPFPKNPELYQKGESRHSWRIAATFESRLFRLAKLPQQALGYGEDSPFNLSLTARQRIICLAKHTVACFPPTFHRSCRAGEHWGKPPVAMELVLGAQLREQRIRRWDLVAANRLQRFRPFGTDRADVARWPRWSRLLNGR
jgi:hypothetical protein